MFKLTTGGQEIGTYKTSDDAALVLGRMTILGQDVSSAKVTEIEHPIEGNLRAIKAEMERKPDAHALVKWIDLNVWSTGGSDPVLGAIATAINTYFVAIEDQ